MEATPSGPSQRSPSGLTPSKFPEIPMRQVFQHLQSGALLVESLPTPVVKPGYVLIQTECSLISAGTERMLVGFGRSGFLQKARSQPDKVRQVLQKMKTDGLLPTLAAVRSKLSVPLPLGYSQAGRVLAVGEGVQGIQVGDRAASNGPHAETVLVPAHLAVRIPEHVPAEDACFTVVGTIALQGIRLLEPTLGECHLVMGLGLIGQLAVQVLVANGCRVLAVDPDPAKVALAERHGAIGIPPASAPVRSVMELTAGVGADGVLITASTPSQKPILQSADLCRQRGRIVLVGVVGLDFPRDPFFRKELRFQVSCSYGPGRYDPAYETHGQDYPLGYVRWTEHRNLQAFADLLASGKVRTEHLRSATFPIDQAQQAYDLLMKHRDLMGILLTCPVPEAPVRMVSFAHHPVVTIDRPGLALIGAGNYASSILLPLLDRCPPHRRVSIVSAGGVSAVLAAKRFGFESAGNDVDSILHDSAIHAVLIATRHDSHADLVVRALGAGKHVFVEKPLATTLPQLEAVVAAATRHPQQVLMVGFNRRHAPMSRALQRALEGRIGPLILHASINAGVIPSGHWAHDRQEGGGRVRGEGCHFVDLLRHWVGYPITHLEVRLARHAATGHTVEDIAAIDLAFADGSLGTIHYFSNGHKGVPKERYTLSWQGRQAELVNWRSLTFHGGGKPLRSWLRQDKGQEACLGAFLKACAEGEVPNRDAYFEVARTMVESG